MSIVNLFTRTSPTIAGFEFDAVLEDTLELSVTVTGYTIELGARVGDHRVINPTTWKLTGAVSNNPVSVSVTDFVGAFVPDDNAGLAAAAGLSAGLLSGSDDARAASALEFLIELMQYGNPFDIHAGDVQLKNMVITKLSRTKNPENEEALIFTAELAEFPYLSTALTYTQPRVPQLPANDPIRTQAAASVSLGIIAAVTASAATLALTKGVV